MAQPVLTEWHTEHLRLSVFLADPVQPGPVDSWVDVAGQDSDDTRIKGTGNQRVVSQEGPFRDKRMRADVRMDRIDWFLLPSPPATPGIRPTAGPYDGLADSFRGCMLAWLDAAGVVANRMAFGAQLNLRSGDRTGALTVLDGLLATVQMDVRNTWDFEYSVNRRRTSQVLADCPINRVAKWFLGRQVLGAIDLSFNCGSPRINTTTVHLPVLMLDVNTAPEFPGPLDRLDKLLQELVGLGTEIALKGDVP